ncbi:MAG: 30S ribosomal protein S2 [Ignavibacteriales bacterium]|nr:30S ribosomal protein S2 [Ignavibacteriaceae bacterium]MCK6615037.1 30S ribosomal protein S2 [Ignavibacteriaceae bacterium]QOJ28583.1 MAG: 30S ribosomal protein S2 [Ignavibacteriales bacterium]
MPKLDLLQLVEAGAHFGHLTRRWNPKMKPYIFMEKNGIHIIDLKKTQVLVDEVAQAISDFVAQGNRILFVGTKKQAKNILETEARRCEMNWVTERWLGGMLTNFATIKKSIKRLQGIEKQESDGTFEMRTKKERLFLSREKAKLRNVFEGMETMPRLPNALFVVDIKKEAIAVQEAKKLNIPVFAIVDTNCDPDTVDYVIPANDDAVKTIELITKVIADAIIEGNMKSKEVKAEAAAETERVAKEGRPPRKEQKKDTEKA